jgi:hypothetical protein
LIRNAAAMFRQTEANKVGARPCRAVALRRLILLACCLLSLASTAHGSLWESGNWAVTGTMNGSMGYDSNLTVSHDGPEDYFLIANPFLTFSRRNSGTDFRINGNVTQTEFLHNRQPAQTDLTFDFIYAYPKASNVIPVYRLEASWLKSAQPNLYLGARARNKQLSFDAEGYLPVSGKLGVRGTANFDSVDYDSVQLNQSQRSEAFVGLAYQRTPQSELSLNFGTAFGHSSPNDPARVSWDVHSNEFYATARLRGELTAKISGSIYGGFGQVRYTGGYANQKNIPVGGANLTWAIDPHRTLMLTGLKGATYSPDGVTANITRAALTFTNVIIDRWQYALRAGASHSNYGRVVRERTDDSWDLGTEFAYQPSLRFRISLALTYTNQSSDLLVAEFKHTVASLGASYRF